jgi:hypothetical protein
MLLKMVDDTYANNNMNMRGNNNEQYPEVPEEAIVKPEDERPARTIKRPEEELSGDEGKLDDIDEGEENSSNMDGDGSPDWGPAVSPGI